MRYNLVLSFIVLFVIRGTLLNGQNIDLNIQSGYVELPAFTEEDISIRNYYFAQILNPNRITGKNFSFRVVIKSNNLIITSNVDRSNAISLNGEPVKIVDNSIIARLFRLDGLVFQGITKEQYLSNGLPDGLYEVCFEMFDVTFDAANTVSQRCILQQVKTHDPPAFTLPTNNSILNFGETHAFQWRPRHITAYPVSYEYFVYEYKDNWTYGSALAFERPIISYVSPTLSHFVQTQDLEEYVDTKLVAVVRVFSENPNLKFKNNGFSEPLIFSIGDKNKTEENQMNCGIPDAEFFINEISQGCINAGYGSKEYIELVVAKGKGGIWNLNQRIIDDNNYLLPEIGNEPGHIRLGSCFQNIPIGTIILIYNDHDIHPFINPNNDGTPNAWGVYQVPFSDPCIEKYDNCPNQTNNDDYDCSQTNYTDEWNHYIPMRNTNDVLQIRSPDESFLHGLRWGNTPNENETDGRMVTITSGSAENLTFVFEKGTDWNAVDNWTTVTACTGSEGIQNQGQESPGWPNSIANQNLINDIKNGTLSNGFDIECITLNTPTIYGEINMLNGSGIYEITVGNMAPVITSDNPYIVSNLPIGSYSVSVRDTIFDCLAYCTLDFTCEMTGQECNDYNDCTVNDTLNYQCECVGEQIIEVVIEEDILIDTLCSYCIPIGPLFYDLAANDYIITHSISLIVPTGDLVTLDINDNVQGFNFPYCYGGPPSNCIGYSSTISEFPSHFNSWVTNNNYQGNFQGDKFCSVGLFMSLSNLDIIEMTGTSPSGDTISMVPINEACEYDTTYQLFIESGCDSIGQYTWSTGEETSTIEIDSLGGCYEVTITCLTDTTNYCELVGQYGENCEDCVVGSECDDGDPCTANDQIDVNCECTGIEFPDSDGDGVCDEEDQCFGYDDNEDSDEDGVPDGCDLCHGQPDSVLPEWVVDLLQDGDPENDPDLSQWGCEEYPCNDTLNVTSTIIGSNTCDYCIDLTSVVNQQDDLKHITSVSYKVEGVPGSFDYDLETVLIDEDFEQGMGVWNCSGDCARQNTVYSHSPEHSIELRGYNASVNSDNLNICNVFQVELEFTFLSRGYNPGHYFLVEYKNSGQSWMTIEQYNYGQDFTNFVRYFESLEIFGPFSTSTQFRIIAFAANSKDRLFIDDMKINVKKSAAYSCDDTGDDDFIGTWLNQFAQELDYYGFALGPVDYTDGYSSLCDATGNIVSIENVRVELLSASYYTATGSGLLSFYSPNCGDLAPGEFYTEHVVDIDCEDADILWSNGMTTDTILVPSEGGYSVSVTCPDGCVYTDTIPGDCMVGEGPCQPSLCFNNDGYYDQYCDCVGATPIENGDPDFDLDGDGLCGTDDPCPCDGENVDTDGDGICDCEECPSIPPIYKKIKSNPIYEEFCDYIIPIHLASNYLLTNVELNGNSLLNVDILNFDYCYDLVELECETTSDIFDSNYEIIPSLRRFISDFRYYLSSQGYSNFVFKHTIIGNEDYLELNNISITSLDLIFQNTTVSASTSQNDCHQVQTAQELYVNETLNGSNDYECVPLTYLWSNGATTSTITVPYPSTAGYCLTVTCDDGCEVETCLEGSCIYGAPCNDYDTCTINDVFDAFCNCVGEAFPDSDGDGVSDLCDLCPGHDDNLDTDNDSIPDGCDTCDVSPLLCDYCTGFPYIANSKFLIIEEFDITYNGVQVADDLNSQVNGLCVSLGAVDNCPGGSQQDVLIFLINQWIQSNGYTGQASIIQPSVGSHPCCPAPLDDDEDNGDSNRSRIPTCILLTIESTDLNFNSITASYGWQIASADFMQHNCVGGPVECDDGDDCTYDDHYDENCNCVGTFLDSDNDWVCDLYDKCPGHPDYMDADEDGIPDGCDKISIPCDSTTFLPLCEYLENRISCVNAYNNLVQYDLRYVQDELIAFFEELDWQAEHFDIPALIYSLQTELDSDGDRVFDYFDPCPCFFNQSLYDTGVLSGTELAECCGVQFDDDCNGSVSNIITDGTQAQLLVQWMFAVQQDMYNGNPPACAEYLDIDMIETAEGWTYNADTCTVRFTVNCDCECDYEIVDDFDGDGICNAIDTLFGEDCEITCDPGVCQYAEIVDCECIIKDLPDTDGDGVCDLVDECQPGPGITFPPGGTPQEFDDLLDSDGDGTPDCKDACPTGGWMGLEDPELPTPTGPGDPCDDGDPCTFADAISENCNCEGVLLDFDDDGTADCGDCIIYYDDTSTMAVDYVEVNPNINFIDCDNCYFVGLDMNEDGVPDVPCDICPQLADSLDYNGNGVPDCIDPPYMEIGCPDTSAIILEPEAGIMLSFNSSEIELEDLPNPIGVIISVGSPGANDIQTYEYVTLTFTREVDGNFEAFYSIPDLNYTNDLDYAGVSYANHQNCVIYSNEENVGITCPTDLTVNSESNLIELNIEIPGGNNADLLNFFGTYSVNLTSNQGGAPINMTTDVTGADISSAGGDTYKVFLDVAPQGTGAFSEYSGTITLPNGVACPYTNGEVEECTGQGADVGDPCDDNDPCTHHDRYDENCECTGDAKPDSDDDGLCDEIDPCPDVPNTAPDLDGDGYLDCPCPPVVLTADAIVSGGDVLFPIDESSTAGIDEFTFSVEGGPDGTIYDTTGTEMPVTVENLPKGYVYEITIMAQGNNGCMSDTMITVEIPFGSDPALCGLEIEPFDLTTVTLLSNLNSGEQFVASDFDINVKQAEGSFGKFTGKGYIKVPYLNLVRINVSFNDITISADRQMIDGVIIVNGYGLAVLGDPLSDDINNIITDIISVLDDINDILDELIPLLETIDELIATTEDLVDEATKNCVLTAKQELEVLQQQAEQNPNDPGLVQEIKNKAAELKQCIEDYEAELALILDGLASFVPYAVDLLAVDQNVCPSNLPNLYSSENEKYRPQFDAEKSAIMQNWQGSNVGIESDTSLVVNYALPELDFDETELNTYYFDVVLQHDFCNAMQNLDAGFDSTNPQELLKNVKIFASLLIEVGDEIVDQMSSMIKEGKTNSEIYSATKDDLITGFKNVLLSKAYQRF